MDQRDAVKRSIEYGDARERERKTPFNVPGWLDGAVPAGAVMLGLGLIAAAAALAFGLWALLT